MKLTEHRLNFLLSLSVLVAVCGCTTERAVEAPESSAVERAVTEQSLADTKLIFPAPGALPRIETQDAQEAWALAVEALPYVSTNACPDADAVSVYEYERVEYRADGSYVSETVDLSKALTQRGLEQMRYFSTWNNDFYGSVTVSCVRVHSPSGTVRDIDLEANLREAVDSSSLSSNIHDPNSKRISVTIPGLQVGDAIESRIVRVVERARAKESFSDYITFEETNPVMWQCFEVSEPPELPIRSRALRDASAVVINYTATTNAAGRITERWIANGVEQYFREPDMPPAYSCIARLLISTAPDWPHFSRWYAKLCEENLAAVNDAMRDKVAELVAGKDDRMDKIRALFDFVSRDVRYMGAMAENEAPGYEPHKVSLTFDRRYGVCRDKAALLVAMLRLAGIDAWPVLINVGPNKDPDVPQPYFNHAIVAAASLDESDPYILMDPTDESTRSLLPEYLCEMSYLVARENGEGIRTTPPLPVADNMLRSDVDVAVQTDGSAKVDVTIDFGGINDAAYRGYLAKISKSNAHKFFERLSSAAFPNSVLLDWSVEPSLEALRSSTDQLKVRMSFVSPGALCASPSNSAIAFMRAPGFGRLAIATSRLGNLGLEKRRFPLETEYPCGYEETVRIALPEGVRIESAQETSFATNSVLYSRTVDNAAHEGNVALVSRRLEIQKSKYSPEEYSTLKTLTQVQAAANREPPIVVGTGIPRAEPDLEGAAAQAVDPQQADDIYLEARDVVVDLRNAPAEWSVETTERRKILTYGGKRSGSDLKFYFISNVSTIDIIDARTIDADGVEHVIDPKLDVFEGDQDWVSAAPRYPAGRVKTVSFPKTEIGSTLVHTVRHSITNREYFSAAVQLGRYTSFGRDSLTILGTNSESRLMAECFLSPYKSILGLDVVKEVIEEGGVRYTVNGKGPDSSVLTEVAMPDSRKMFPYVAGSAQTVAERAIAIRDALWTRSDPQKSTNTAQLARSLVAEGVGVEQCVRAIRDWVDENLRIAGPNPNDLPLSILSSADEVFEDGYGHSMDRAVLYLAMARALGLECELCFYNSDWVGVSKEEFTRDFLPLGMLHSISTVAVRVKDGSRYLYLDGSSRYAPITLIRHDGAPALILPADSQCEDTPLFQSDEREPFTDPGAPFVRSIFDVVIADDLSARVSARLEHGGGGAEVIRKRYSRMLPEERSRHIQQLVKNFDESATLVGEFVSSIEGDQVPYLEYTVDIPDWAVLSSTNLIFSLPGVIPNIANQLVMRPRVFPFECGSITPERVTWRVHFPKGYKALLLPIEDSFGDLSDPALDPFAMGYSRTVKPLDDGVEVSIECRRKPTELPAAAYFDFMRRVIRSNNMYTGKFVLVPNS